MVGEESATDYNSRADLDSLVRPGVDLQLPPVSAEMSARMNEVMFIYHPPVNSVNVKKKCHVEYFDTCMEY